MTCQNVFSAPTWLYGVSLVIDNQLIIFVTSLLLIATNRSSQANFQLIFCFSITFEVYI